MVASAPDPMLAFAEYVQQNLGVPWPTMQDQAILRKRLFEFFDHYPSADYYTLCRLVQWCKSRKKRDTRVWQIVDRFREAWVAGALPELEPSRVDASVELRIARALEVERAESWRVRLLATVGTQPRRAAIDAWERERGGRPWNTTTASQ